MNVSVGRQGLWSLPGDGVLARQGDLILLSAVDASSAANPHHPARIARRVAPAPVQGNWCLYYHAGGANCRFGDFQGCMLCGSGIWRQLSTQPVLGRYGDQLPPLERWQYGATPYYCVNIDDARCY